MLVNWNDFKVFVNSRSLNIQGIETSECYDLRAQDDFFSLECRLYKNPSDETDITDFEGNYKFGWNKKLKKTDEENIPLMKTQVAQSGWHFEPRSLDFFVGKHNSLYNRLSSGTMDVEGADDAGDGVLVFLTTSGTPIIKGESEEESAYQTRLDETCVASKVIFTPDYNWKPIGASIQVVNKPNWSAYLWGYIDLSIFEAPNINFLNGGWNIRFAQDGATSYKIDARTTSDDPIPAGLPFVILVRHGLVNNTTRFGVQVALEHYRK